MRLPERVVALHHALAGAHVPHAFGGAIALAYCTHNPRGTSDIDVNVFVPADDPTRVLRALPAGIIQPEDTAATIRRDGQIRLRWDETPIDLFFDNVPVHADAAAHRHTVPFAGTTIPVLGAIELSVFKAMFDRSQDWVDIESILRAESVDLNAVRSTLHAMLPADDPRFARLAEAERRAMTHEH